MARFFRYSLTFLLLLAILMECAQVLLRYIFHMPAMWLEEIIIFPAIWMYMLGCANASRDNTQIVAKILPVLFPRPRSVAVFDFFAQAFSVIISSWLTWYAVEYFIYSINVPRKTGYLFWPFYIGETAISFAMVLITIYSCIHFYYSLKNLCHIFGQGAKQC